MVVLAVIVGLAGGAALTAFAGARRTDTAVDRMMAYTHAPNANVGAEDPHVLDQVLHLPQVAHYTVGSYMLMAPLDAAGHPFRKGDLGTQAIVDGGFNSSGRPLVLAGRVPRPDRPDEAFINASGASATGFGVGSRIRLQGWLPDQAQELLRGSDIPPTGPQVEVRVVGVGRFPSELSTTPAARDVVYAGSNFLVLTPAFYKAYGQGIASAGVGGSVELKGGIASLPAYQDAVRQVSPDVFVDAGTDDLVAAVNAKRATSIAALALLLFGILAALVAIAVVAQALGRQSFVDAAEYPALAAMGMTRAQLIVVAAARAVVIGAVGAVVAVVVAYLLSPRMPIGLARQAEVHPGLSFDSAVLVLGAVAIVAVFAVAAALAAWRTARAAGVAPGPVAIGTEHPSRVSDRLARTGAPPSAVVGVRMALEPGRGATAVPVRTTLVSAAMAVALLVATLSFGASLRHLADTPVLQGWNWDVSVGNPHSDDVRETAVPALDGNLDVAAFSGVAGPAGARVKGHNLAVMGVETVKGSVLPPIIEGRAPSGPGEIAIANRDVRRLHAKVGEEVPVEVPGQPPVQMRVVGRMVLTPSIVNGQIRIGDGALVTMQTFKASLAPGQGNDSESTGENVFTIRFKPGVHRAAALARLRTDFPGTVLTALRPADIENLRRVSALPSVLAALFAAVALVTVGHMLVSSVRRRRHDVAILRTMGFVRRQVAAAVAWQATTVALVGLIVGVPLGVAAGRWTWGLVASQLGVRDEPVVPLLVVVIVVAGTLLVANALASLPGVVAARTRPAEILRAE
jgi:hypothetical protein